MKNKLLFFYPLLLLGYSIFSYSQTTPNLVLSSNSFFWQFQQMMWQLGYHNRHLSSLIYAVLVAGLFGMFFYMLKLLKTQQLKINHLILISGLNILALLPSYPGLSNDIFNYLMNAKMMHVYHASPYKHAAWEFPDDPWLAFMMNVHTTTPYGYVWTGLGYLIYWLTLGDLQLGMLGFRLLAILALALCAWSIWIISGKKIEAVGLFCLNPLVLIEAVNNTHNDITMMGLFMIGLALHTIYYRRSKIKSRLYLSFFWILSVYTKLVTIIFPFIWIVFVAIKKFLPKKINLFDLLALSLVLIMMADGSKRFFSWYLLWSLPIASLAKSGYVRNVLIVLSMGGLYSYLPFLYTGEYTNQLGLIRQGIYFIPAMVYSIVYFSISKIRKLANAI